MIYPFKRTVPFTVVSGTAVVELLCTRLNAHVLTQQINSVGKCNLCLV